MSNVSEKLEQTPNTLDEEARRELELALDYLREAIASPHWVDACLHSGSCFVVEGQSDEITNIFDIHGSYLRRSPLHPGSQHRALIPVVRFTHLGTALHTGRQQELAACSWHDGSALDSQIADIGYQRLVQEQAPKPPRQTGRPTDPGETIAALQDQAQVNPSQSPRSPSRARSMVQQVKMKFHKKKATSTRMNKENYTRAREEALRRKNIPLLPIPPDSSLRSARILGTGSAKIDFVVNQILDAPPDDYFIIFSDPDYNMTQFHEALLSVNCIRILADAELSDFSHNADMRGSIISSAKELCLKK